MAKRSSTFKLIRLVSWGLKFAIVASTLWLIYIGLYAWALNAGIVSVLVFLPNIIAYKTNAQLPWPFDFLISAALAVHILGFSLRLYPNIPYYDVFAHFVSSAFIGMFAFSVLMILRYHTTKIKLTPRLTMLIIIMATVTTGVVWEFYEWANDLVLFAGLPHEQWSVGDTMRDMLVNVLGGGFVALVGRTWVKHTPKYKLKDIFNYPNLAKWLKNRLS